VNEEGSQFTKKKTGPLSKNWLEKGRAKGKNGSRRAALLGQSEGIIMREKSKEAPTKQKLGDFNLCLGMKGLGHLQHEKYKF